jgi:hypothetical protein
VVGGVLEAGPALPTGWRLGVRVEAPASARG